MNHDALLQWASERGGGSVTAFRQAHDWLAAAEPTSTTPHWTWTLQSLQSLGHLEVDWDARRWEAAPATIATLAGGGGYALLCGARPEWFLRRLRSLAVDPDLGFLADNILLEEPVPQQRGPALRLLTLDEDEDAAQLCAALGVEYSPFAADRLLRLLPSLNDILRARRRTDPDLPGGVLPQRMGAGHPGQRLFEDISDLAQIGPGAYRIALFDVRRYFYVHAPGHIFEAGRGEVIYAELRRRNCQVLQWDPDDYSLLVPARFRLPDLYERAAVLRTGLLPAEETVGTDRPAQILRYRNIDRAFADRLGQNLGQRVATASDESDSASSNPAREVR